MTEVINCPLVLEIPVSGAERGCALAELALSVQVPRAALSQGGAHVGGGRMVMSPWLLGSTNLPTAQGDFADGEEKEEKDF